MFRDLLPDGVEERAPFDDLKLYIYGPRDQRGAAISAARAQIRGCFLGEETHAELALEEGMFAYLKRHNLHPFVLSPNIC